jgi:hypothetical protein
MYAGWYGLSRSGAKAAVPVGELGVGAHLVHKLPVNLAGSALPRHGRRRRWEHCTSTCASQLSRRIHQYMQEWRLALQGFKV